jgi:hypothetical protein
MKTKKFPLLLASLFLALLTLSAVSVDRLKAHVTWLADPAREGRYAGSAGSTAAGDYIAQQFREVGCDVQIQDFGGRRRNVIGRIGSAPRYVLVGAHYDGQGRGRPSASDNAAGVAVTIEILRELKSKQLPVSLVAVAFDDEEQGLNGSRYFTDHPPYPLENAQAAIIFDTMGRQFMDLSTWTMFVLGTEYSRELATVVQKRSRPDMFVVGTDLIGPRSDFAPFAVKHVPYLFFSHATHKDYHGPGDTPDRIDYTKLAQDANLIAQMVEDVARLQEQPKYLNQPVYPAGETAALQKEVEIVEKERKDLPEAYRFMFDDIKMRLKSDDSRELRRIGTTVLLALATPSFSSFMLTFFVGPYYESEGRRDLAVGAYKEALKWASSGAERQELEEKIRAR